MKLQINYKHLAAEFVIVVVGVAVALAADNWRSGIGERRLEIDYLGRLLEDFESGQAQLQLLYFRQTEAMDSSFKLAEILLNESVDVDEATLGNHLIRAARTSYNRATLQHDATYRELLATGRLNLIRDANLISELAEYYNRIENIDYFRERVPDTVRSAFLRYAGTNAYRVEYWQDLDFASRSRLMTAILETPNIADEFRELGGRLDTNVAARFPRAIEMNEQIVSLFEEKLL